LTRAISSGELAYKLHVPSSSKTGVTL